jgi:hypothetical protein
MSYFSFLQLPRELRDRIYESALESRIEPPKSPEDPVIFDCRELRATGRRTMVTLLVTVCSVVIVK